MKKITPLVSVLTAALLTSSLSMAQIRPGPGPIPNPPAPPVEPAKKELDTRKTEEAARAGAEAFVNDVLEYVGDAYQVRYNLREGILNGKSRIGDYDNEANVKRSALYSDNYESGSVNGRARGLEAGINYSQRAAYSLADSDIGLAIDAAIDNHSQIVLNPNPRMVQFDGLSSNLSVPSDILTRLVSNTSSTQSEVRRMVEDRLPGDLFQEIFEIKSIYREHRTEIPDVFKNDQAFDNFIRNSLNSNSGKSDEIRRYYNEIRDGNVYARPQDNERAFRQGFLYNYSRMIDRAWRDRVQSTNNRAYNLGEDLYVAAANSLAKELGNYDGYNSQYRVATKETFQANFINDYNAAYPQIVQKIKTTSHITTIRAGVISTSGKKEVVYGDTLDVVLQSITNRGMVDGAVKIEIVPSSQVQSTNNPQSITVPGLTRDSDAKIFPQMAVVSAINGVDETITANVSIGDQIISTTFSSSYEEKIRRLVQTQNPAIAKVLLEKSLSQMKAQYDSLSGWSDQYQKRRGDMLLVRVLNLYKTLSEPERMQLRTYKKSFYNVFGSKPGIFSMKRDEWEEAWKMLKEMKM